MTTAAETITLTEYEPTLLARERLSDETARTLHSAFGTQVDVQPPSFLNDQRWKLTSQGWVGCIPLTPDLHLHLAPKVPASLFRMLEYAYRLDFRILAGLSSSATLNDVYERLAVVLAKRVLDRIRNGLYRSYLSDSDELPFVRGRIDVATQTRRPWNALLRCDFQEHTADLEDNQVLAWTLTRVLESGVCSERSLPYIRQARRALLSFASLREFSARSCIDRLYNRLNYDYGSMHALCRFFLEQTGPSQGPGGHRMLPILVDMERLFEMFVFEWLRKHMPWGYQVRGQEIVQFQAGPWSDPRFPRHLESVFRFGFSGRATLSVRDFGAPSVERFRCSPRAMPAAAA